MTGKGLAGVLAAVAAVLIACSTLLTTIAGFEWGTAEGGGTTVVTDTVEAVPIPGPGPNVVIDDDRQAEPDEGAEVGELGAGVHEDMRDETPPGVTQDEVDAIEDSRPAGLGTPQPVGGAQLLPCTFRPVVNQSARATGARVSQVVYHFTVSPPGSLEVIRNLFNDPDFSASSHTLLEPGGRCVNIVPFERKAWTQGAFNSVSDSVEIVCCRTTPTRAWWLAQPIIKAKLLAAWTVDRLRARGLKPVLVNPEGCTPRAGVTDHARLECGNNHTDVGTAFPFDVVMAQTRELFNVGATLDVWRAMSGGAVLRQTKAIELESGNGYDRLLAWMSGPGEGAVKAAERENGQVKILRLKVPLE